MNWWVFKCNSKKRSYNAVSGDWNDVFEQSEVYQWGSTEHGRFGKQLEQLKPKNLIIAYQTDRNELVGCCEVDHLEPRGKYKDVYLLPLETIGVKVRPLKDRDRKVAAIPAFKKTGRIRTIYEISEADAIHLLEIARSAKRVARFPSSRQ